MIDFRYDTQLLIEGENLDEDAINDYFIEHLKGDCLQFHKEKSRFSSVFPSFPAKSDYPLRPRACRSISSTTISWISPREAQYSSTFQGSLVW